MVVAGKEVDPQWAWARYRPDAAHPWNLAMAGHLYRRAAFGADWDRLRQALADGPQKTIDRLLKPQGDAETFNRTYDDYEASAAGSESADNLRPWWLRRMIQTPHPLLEKMTLLWHSHFAVSNFKVKNARLMQQHVQLLRNNALGSFESLLGAICEDPAMLISVDAAENRKARPNNNFAGVLFDAFTVGPGNYTENDIHESARAFTGWFVRRGESLFIRHQHDDKPKRIFAQAGSFAGADVVRILLRQPATAQMVVRKLYRLLICETEQVQDRLVAPLAESFAKDYDISRLVGTMLRSNLFFSSAAYRRRVKCPVEFAVGIVRGLEAMVSTTQLAEDTANLGRNLYHPPTVKGWTGGKYWINDATLMGRHNLAVAMLAGSGPYGGKLDPWAVAGRHEHTTLDSATQFAIDLFLQGDIPENTRNALTETAAKNKGKPADVMRQCVHAIVTLPEFHLA